MADHRGRIDKWLWAVRIYKTRSMASEACRSGKVEINGMNVKASREIITGDVIQIRIGLLNKKVKVLEVLENRISAKLVPQYMEDLTPPEEYKKIDIMRDSRFVYRDRGAGRPTKRDRRDIDKQLPDW